MSVSVSSDTSRPVVPVRRVRHDVRDGLAVMLFSLGASSVVGLAFTFLAGLGK